MHARPLITVLCVFLSTLAIAGCSDPPAPTPPSERPAKPVDPKANPLAGTVLEAQGDAMQKARGVQDTLQQSADQRRAEIDAEAQ